MILLWLECDANGVTEISLETVAFARSLSAAGGGIAIRAALFGDVPEAGRDQLLTADQAIRLHLPELLAQYLRRDARHRSLQLAKPERPRSEPLQDHRLPPSVDDCNRGVERTGRTLLMTRRRRRRAVGVLRSTVLRLL